MVKTRVILAILAGALSFAIYTVSASQIGQLQLGLCIIFGILLLASINVLTFSFMRVDETPSGELCFEKNNLLWRVISHFSERARDGSISLCRAYWTVVFAQLVAAGFLGLAGIIIMTIFLAIISHQVLQVLAVLGGIVLCVLILFGALTVSGNIKERMNYDTRRKVGKVMGKVGTGFLGAFLLAVLALVTIGIAHALGTSYLVAILYVLGGLIALAAVIALVRLAFIKLPALRNTPLGKVFGAAKDTLCPTLVSCEYRKREEEWYKIYDQIYR